MRLQTSNIFSQYVSHATAAAESAATLAAAVLAISAATEGGGSTPTATSELAVVLLLVAHVGAGGLLLVRGGDNFRRQCQVLAQVLDASIGQVHVVVLPRECDLDMTTRLQRLDQHEHFQVGRAFNVRVRLRASVFLHHQDALLEEVAEHSDAAFLGNKHPSSLPVVL